MVVNTVMGYKPFSRALTFVLVRVIRILCSGASVVGFLAISAMLMFPRVQFLDENMRFLTKNRLS